MLRPPDDLSSLRHPWPPRRLAGAGLAVLCAAALAAARGLARRGRRRTRDRRLGRRGRRVPRWAAGRGHARLDATIAEARRTNDRFALARLLRIDGALYAGVGEANAALPRLAEAATLAAAQRDSAALLRILRWQAYAYGSLGRLDDAWRAASEQRRLAQLTREEAFDALGRASQGWVLMRRGEFARARAETEAAARRLRALGEENFESLALAPLGSLQMAAADYRAARVTYTRKLELARRARSSFSEAQALNDLGVLENFVGDPALALEMFEQAERMHVDRGEWREAVEAMVNRSNALMSLGRWVEAERLIHEVQAICDREGYRETHALMQVALGDLAYSRQRFGTARREWRASLEAGDTLSARASMSAITGLTAMLAAHDSLDAALALVARHGHGLRGRVDETWYARFETLVGRLLVKAGRADEAVPRLRAVAEPAATRGEHGVASQAWLEMARAFRRLGRPGDAAAALECATLEWERARRASLDPEWREWAGASARQLAAECVDFAWHDGTRAPRERLAAAFVAAQRFKARTLAERCAGPGAFTASDSARFTQRPATLREVQQQVLRPGELLLEYLVGADSTWCFVVGPDTATVLRLAGRDSLTRLVQIAIDVTASPERTSAGAADGALRALGGVLLSGPSTLLASAGTVLVAPDDVLQGVPFGALPLPGESSALAGRVELSRVPSATLLRALRESRRAPPRRGMLALAAGSDTGQVSLAGAGREVRALGRLYRGVDVYTSADSTAPRDAAGLADWAVLHLAGHTQVHDQRPWRSGLVLRDAGRGGERARLLAEDVARSRLSADLAVLSGCESAGGPVLSGEGVAGLSSAFLASGVPSVVATLWPVDDAGTERLAARFYDALARGESAAHALALAQQDLRRDPRTRHPFYWAGWVLVGEPDTRVPLVRRPLPPLGFALYLVLGLALAVGALVIARVVRRPTAKRV